MEIGRILEGIIAQERISKGKLADDIGISRQALYKRLHGDMGVESLKEILKAIGWEMKLYKVVDGKVVESRRVE